MRKWLAAIALAALLAACAEPLPPDKVKFAGDWRAKEMRLLITSDGRVSYERQRGSASTKVDAPIQRFDGDNLVVGVGVFTTTFVVSKPPYQDGPVWKMVVDGVELTRADPGEGHRA